MKIGGEGIETQVREGVLQIRSTSRMLGYLNAPSPFDGEGWYDTKDVVEVKGDYVKVTGRITDVINVGGLKFMASDIERVALVHPEVALVKVEPRANPITGQHIEMVVQPLVADRFDKVAFLEFLKSKLQPHMVPRRIVVEAVSVGHRFKKT
jgi:acyl-CoA synthetase (AMP-forming)/AMP-acid ligase II